MSAATTIPARSHRVPSDSVQRMAQWGLVAAFRPLHALMAWPALLFMATLAAMLFRPPDVRLYYLDRIAFALLVFVVLLRVLIRRQPLPITGPVKWPMLGMLALALLDVLAQPYQAEAWSLLAAKWVVPFAMYYMAGLVFEDEVSLHRFETFALVVLAYLCITSIFFLLGTKSLIFPPFIADESLGIHADRARGPFLQAVANGVTLNLLGLIAIDSFRRRRLRGLLALLFLIALPVAVLATKTRAVWLSFAASVLGLLLFSPSPRVRRACLCLVLAAVAGVLSVLAFEDVNRSFSDRLEERSPVEFRWALYRAGWDMFQAKPLWGWGATAMQTDLSMRISDFHQEAFFFHNTYLEIAVEHGAVGLAFYLWIVVDLFRLRRYPGRSCNEPAISPDGSFLDRQFRSLWPVLLAVYLLNGCFVVMNYQFVNGLLFTLAGILAAQNRASAVQSSSLSAG